MKYGASKRTNRRMSQQTNHPTNELKPNQKRTNGTKQTKRTGKRMNALCAYMFVWYGMAWYGV